MLAAWALSPHLDETVPQKVLFCDPLGGRSHTRLTFVAAATYDSFMEFLARLIQLVSYIVIFDVLLRWVQRPHQAPLKWTMQVTEPLYAPIRNALPSMGGLDLSPLVLIVGLNLLQMLLYQGLG